MVNIAFTITPMSAPGSAALLTLFRLSRTHRCCSTWGGSVFILAFSAGVCAICSGVLKAISPVTLPHRFLFLSTYTTQYRLFSDFSLSPVFTAVDFGITALHRDRLMSVIGFVRRLLRLLIIIRPDTLIFLTGE